MRHVLRRVRRLSDDEVQAVLGDVLSRFEHRHRGIEEILEENCDNALSAVGDSDPLSRSHRIRETLAVKLFNKFEENSGDDWPWPENCLSYANGKLPHALLLGGQWMQRDDLIEMGLRSLKWLLQAQTGHDGVFSPIGNRGWFKRGGRKASFDQQPIEAHALLDACLEARNVTDDEQCVREARRCFNWFLGKTTSKSRCTTTKPEVVATGFRLKVSIQTKGSSRRWPGCCPYWP